MEKRYLLKRLTLFCVILILCNLPNVSAAVKCWEGSNVYLNRGSITPANGRYPQLDKFCKCTTGLYHYFNYQLGTIQNPVDTHEYTDIGNNANWQTQQRLSDTPVIRVQCLDGANPRWFETNLDHYTSTSFTTSTTTTSTTIPYIDLEAIDLAPFNGSVYYRVRNDGTRDCPPNHIILLTEYVPVAQEILPAIPALTDYTGKFNYSYNCTPPYDRMGICADSKFAVTEKDELNNCKEEIWVCGTTTSTTTTTSTKQDTSTSTLSTTSSTTQTSTTLDVDLVIKDIWSSSGKIYYKIRNQGNTDAEESITTTYIDGMFLLKNNIAQIPAKKEISSTMTANWTCSGNDDTIKVCADTENKIAETDENNNCREEIWQCNNQTTSTTTSTTSSTTTSTTLDIDLVIKDIWSSSGKIYYKIRNQGNADAEESITTTYIDGMFLLKNNIAQIPAKKEISSTMTANWTCSGNDDTIKVCADTENKIAETDENNNCREEIFTCRTTTTTTSTTTTTLAKPDLVISDIWTQDDAIYYKIKNIGPGSAHSSFTALYIDDEYIKWDFVFSMDAGDQKSEIFDYEWTCTDMYDTIRLCADQSDSLQEKNESNNCKTITMKCDPVNPTIVTTTTSMTSTTQGTSTTTTPSSTSTITPVSSTQATTTTLPSASTTTQPQSTSTSVPVTSSIPSTTITGRTNPTTTAPESSTTSTTQTTETTISTSSTSGPTTSTLPGTGIDVKPSIKASSTIGVGIDAEYDASETDPREGVSFEWDFGDGTRMTGMTVKHYYLLPGSYDIYLNVSDTEGRSVIERFPVEVEFVDLPMELSIEPQQIKYDYGDMIKRITVSVKPPEGLVESNLGIYGLFSANTVKELSFLKKDVCEYMAVVSHPVLKQDGQFIDIYVNATDDFGNRGSILKRLMVLPEDPGFEIVVEEPLDRIYAIGQIARFEVSLINPWDKKTDESDMVLYESWTKRSYQFTQGLNNTYSLMYFIPDDASPESQLYIHGIAAIEGREYHVIKQINLQIKQELNIELVSPRMNDEIDGLIPLILKITYPNGEPYTGEEIDVLVGETEITLKNVDGVFRGKCYVPEGTRNLKLVLADEYGNIGECDIVLTPVKRERDDLEKGFEGITPLVMLTFLSFCTLSFISLIYIHNRRLKRREEVRERYGELEEEINGLKQLKKNMMHQYYIRKISLDDAKQRILDYDKEIEIDIGKLRKLLIKLGMDKNDVRGREEIILWITRKLEEGDSPEMVKKGVMEAGFEPSLVDKVIETIMK